MKINICLGNSNNPLNGYINTNIYENNEFKACHPENLNDIVDDGEAEEILAVNILNYIEYSKVKNVVINWYKKLKYDGTMTISFFDFLETSRLLTTQFISIDDARKLFFGEQIDSWQFFKSGISLTDIKKYFCDINAKIEYCKRDGCISYIKVRRTK